MANKRMIAKNIAESDAFMDMPLSTQALYFHLMLNADDDGFVDSPKKVLRMVGASNDDLKILLAKRFVLPFDEKGIIVIKHWKMHNTIQKDRYVPTAYQEELALLIVKDNKAYAFSDGLNVAENSNVSKMETEWKQNGNTDKNSIDKIRLDNNISNVDCEEVFETVWKLYPRKEGKGQVSKTKKKVLAKIGVDELTRCVERYKYEKRGSEKKYLQMGSTFFNGGYVDYLDKNYQGTYLVETEAKTPEELLQEIIAKGEPVC